MGLQVSPTHLIGFCPPKNFRLLNCYCSVTSEFRNSNCNFNSVAFRVEHNTFIVAVTRGAWLTKYFKTIGT